MQPRSISFLLAIILGITSTCLAQDLNWKQAFPASSPSARDGSAMVYDAARAQIVLFGGLSGTFPNFQNENDIWVWNGTDWTRKSPTMSPDGRQVHAMAYDAAHNEVVLFGGTGQNGLLGDTWVWDGTNWAKKVVSPSPSPRIRFAMAYDSAHEQVVLFGGSGSGGTGFASALADTWVWDGTSWTQESPAAIPSARYGQAMAYDAAHSQIVLFGGGDPTGTLLSSQTWVWNGTNWTQKFPSHNPSARIDHQMVFDTTLGEVVLFGGFGLAGDLNDTWVWDGTDWTQESPSMSPSARRFHVMAYDEAENQAVMFGGFVDIVGAPPFGDTWLLSSAATSCQLNVTKLYQAVDASGAVQPWACDIYNHPYGTERSRYCFTGPQENRIAQVGCALTALAMSLNTVGLSFDPGILNTFMLDHLDFNTDHDVLFDTTVDDVNAADKRDFHWTSFSSTSVHDLASKLCTVKVPIIVGVDLNLNQVNQPVPGHYVLTTGWDGTDFAIADPGYPRRTSLLASYGDNFLAVGYVHDPPNTESSLHISVADAELLVTDPNGEKSGFDVSTSQNLNEIPGSAYSRSGLTNDETGEPPSQFGYDLDIHQPSEGTYSVNVQGLELATYTLTVRAFDADGNPELPLSVPGIESPGSNQIVTIHVVTSAGGTSTTTSTVTFSSTLADIRNSFALGLIDNEGVANSFSQKIQAALAATEPARGEILNAFKNEVGAQSGKHIIGVAPQVLIRDADSLLGHN